jgi:hypothetical protein
VSIAGGVSFLVDEIQNPTGFGQDFLRLFRAYVLRGIVVEGVVACHPDGMGISFVASKNPVA